MPKLRKASVHEISVIQSIGVECYRVTYPPILGDQQVEYMLNKFYTLSSLEEQMTNGHIFLISSENRKDLGFASYNLIDPELGNYQLQKLYVLPEAQGSGLGRFLIESVMDICKKNGGKTLSLNVNRYNDALSFYQKLGFSVRENVDIDIGNGYFMNDYVMKVAF